MPGKNRYLKRFLSLPETVRKISDFQSRLEKKEITTDELGLTLRMVV